MSKAVNPNDPIFYVYVYLDPRKPGHYVYGEYEFDYEPFYVGEGHGKRSTDHIRKRNKHHEFVEYIQNIIIETSDNPYIMYHIENTTETKALIEERKLVKSIGRLNKNTGPLFNKTDGGQGCSGMSVSEETKQILREKRKYQIITEETKRKIGKSNEIIMKGNKNGNKYFVVLSPTKEVFIVSGLKSFAIKKNIPYDRLILTSWGKADHCRGWKCRQLESKNDPKIEQYIEEMKNISIKRNTFGFILTSPEGKEINVKDLTKWCKENNFQRWKFYQILHNKITTWMGWSIRKTC